jgi:hypothetical protein
MQKRGTRTITPPQGKLKKKRQGTEHYKDGADAEMQPERLPQLWCGVM